MALLRNLFQPFHASLPNKDNKNKREEELISRRKDVGYDFALLESLPMLKDFHGLPSFKWTRGVATIASKILLNAIKAKKELKHDVQKMVENQQSIDRLIQNNDNGENSDVINSVVASVLATLDRERINIVCDSLEQYQTIFQSIAPPEIIDNFIEDDDSGFAWLRVAGSNPLVIKKYNADIYRLKFPVSDTDYQSEVPGDSLDRACEENRLFITDYEALKDVKAGITDGKQKYIYAPIVLFALPPDSTDLVPIAIQCGQDPKNSTIVTPKSGEWAWRIAKLIVQIADANHHELISHLGLTHLLMEPFAIATERQLAKDHPLGILLRPHFEGTFFINDQAAKKLISGEDRPVGELLAGTIEDSQGLSIQAIKDVIFDKIMLSDTLAARGVVDQKLLPEYPYRDDALMIWGAINEWVKDYLSIYYRNPDNDIKNDTELQEWAKELINSKGGNLKGIGKGEGGQIQNLADLIELTTQIIFTASAQHAAVNFSQATLMSYAPAMPMAGYAPVPSDLTKATERDFLNILPPIKQAQGQLTLTVLLGSLHYTKLGEYTTLKDPDVQRSLKNFKNNLKKIEHEITEKNKDRRKPYEFLLPSKIPQSINI